MFAARRERNRRLEELRRVPLVAGCTTRELARIDRLGTLVRLPAGRTLTREGAAGRECFLVLDGIAVAHRAGREIGGIGPGSIAGEMALLDRLPRNATVVADTPMQVIVFSDREFAAMVAVAPCIATNVGHVAAGRRTALQRSAVSEPGRRAASARASVL